MKVAILFDGSYFLKKFEQIKRNHGQAPSLPTPNDINVVCSAIMHDVQFEKDFLFRSYFYDCPPLSCIIKNPLDGSEKDLSLSAVNASRSAFFGRIKSMPNMAVRSGVLSVNGWQIPQNQTLRFAKGGNAVTPASIKPNIKQKQVDMKIGLDVAWMSLKRIVDKIVLFTGDSDFIPAMKFARREGILVYVAKFSGYNLKQEIIEHSDGIVDVELALIPAS